MSSLIFLAWMGFLVRLFDLQVAQRASYAEEAASVHRTVRTIAAPRGNIYYAPTKSASDTLRPIAINQRLFTVYAVTRDMSEEQRRAVAVALAGPLATDRDHITQELSTSPDARYVPLADGIPADRIDQIRSLHLTGIGSFAESRRFYPDGAEVGHFTGFLGWEGKESGSDRKVGRYGLEEYLEDTIAGVPGRAETERDAQGRWIPIGERIISQPQNGTDIVTTIEHPVQSVVCNALKETAKKFHADRGTVVVLEPATGAIVALCNTPSFDPNAYGKEKNPSVFANDATQRAYEPGSVFKVITMALGIDAGVVTPETTYVDHGSIKIGPDVIKNAAEKTYGQQTMVDVLKNSVNTGAVFVARALGGERFRSGVASFGFGKATGVELAGEALGDTHTLESGREIYVATGSFGQGISVTPIQLAQAFGAIANDGVMLQPRFIREMRHPDGTTTVMKQEVVRRIISARTAALLKGMLVVVVREGHAKRAGVSGYTIGGKTGTAQVARKDGKGYSSDTIHTFVGMGPMESPRFVIVTKLENPKDVEFAESTAVPLAGEIIKFLLEYWKIPPSE